ncbi:hypothetical protein PFISCL1PPCAC_21175, partial [Pristionchus fissidentatus]
ANLLKFVYRFCPSSKAGLEAYIIENRKSFVTVDDFIDKFSGRCEDPILVREILSDFIDKPGKAFLIVSR